MKTLYPATVLALEKCTVTDRLPVIDEHVAMRQLAGHAYGGNVSAVLSSTVLPSSHVSAGSSRTPLPHVCGFVVVVVVDVVVTDVVVVVVVVVGTAPALATR